ncbi:cytochrome P450 CYP72A616-like [Magnolia sinica]|uniref:cytochrome P450 CYP72A616-like n=1 Tax=Magnolia sinica TaxID=86752 RepID=UPI00265858E1|nr:cytochrome P450 CYP72A616-like [Magnolia sinica]
MGDFLSLFLRISCLLGVSWIVRLVYWVWWKPMKLERQLRAQGFTGPPYRLLFGNLRENSWMVEEALSKPMNLSHQILPRVVPHLYNTVKEYGKMSMNWFGPMPRLNIMDPELIREILSRNDHFEKPPQTPLTKFLATGVAVYRREKWVMHRRLLSPAFHLQKLKCMLPAFSMSCSELVKRWETLIGSQESYELDVWPELQTFAGDVISRTAFGSSYKEGKRIFELQAEQGLLLTKARRIVYIPGFRFLPTKDNLRRKALDRDVTALLRAMIEKREIAMKMGESGNNDLLSLLLESNNNNCNESQEHGKNFKNIRMTTEDIIEECKLFYFAGHETSLVLLTWTMILLSMHPSWQERAREEVLQVFGKNAPDFNGLNHLKIVPMILYEVLRLYIGGVLIRQTYKEMKLGKLTIPPGVQIALPSNLIHRDPEFWGDDAEEFKPERFVGGVSNAAKHQMAFFPFGGGPRICIGQNFAMIESKMALAMILQHFSFELSPLYVHAPKTVITIQPQYGAQIILRKV